MKNIKSTFILSTLLLICILFSSCSNNNTISEKQIRSLIEQSIVEHNKGKSSKQISSDKKTIVFVGKNEGDKFIEEIKKSIEKVCSNNKYNFTTNNSEDPNQVVKYQIQTLQELAISKVEGIILAPASSTELIPAIKKVQDAKIPIVIIDTNIDQNEAKKYGVSDIPFVTIDNEEAEYDVTKIVISEMLSEKKVIKSLIVSGDLSSINAVQRKDGAIKALTDSGIQPVAIADGKWKICTGYEVTKSQLEQNKDINLIICGNDEMALGARQYLNETNRKDVIVLGFDGNPRAVQAVKRGEIKLTVKQSSEEIGKMSLKTLMDVIDGKNNSNLINIKTEVINK